MEVVTRVFCLAEQAPSLADILGGTTIQGLNISVLEPRLDDSIETPWTSEEVVAMTGAGKIQLQCLRKNGPHPEQFLAEIVHFLALVKSMHPQTKAHKRVLDHLNACRFIVKSKFEIADPESELFDFNSAIIVFISDNYHGLIQADGEGFYDEEDEIGVAITP